MKPLSVFLAMALCLGVASAAFAGAWPRAEGEGFAAQSASRERQGLFLEYGLGRGWTLGADIAVTPGREADAMVFAHRLIRDGVAGGVLSGGIALGRHDGRVAVRPGLFWGRGFSDPIGGWVDVALQGDWSRGGGAGLKLDATLGVKPSDRLMMMVQAQGGVWPGAGAGLRIEPAIAFGIGRGRHIVIAPSVGVVGPRDPRVRAVLWLSF